MSRTPLHVFTLALDAMPWIAVVFAELNKLREIPWTWVIVEGAAMNVKDTNWCAPQPPRLSSDGTTEFLDAIAHHPRIRIIRHEQWDGKNAMCNAALATFTESGVLLQNDGDEIWTADQLRAIVEAFEDDMNLMMMRFVCRYFVGANIITDNEGAQNDWLRAWRFKPGDTFSTHEPPVMAGNRGRLLSRDQTHAMGLIFDHYSWCLPKHVGQKEKFYGAKYKGALAGWKQLQAHADFPTKIKPFFPWSNHATTVKEVFPCTS